MALILLSQIGALIIATVHACAGTRLTRRSKATSAHGTELMDDGRWAEAQAHFAEAARLHQLAADHHRLAAILAQIVCVVVVLSIALALVS